MPLYEEGRDCYTLFYCIENFIIFKDQKQQSFKRVVNHWQEVTLDKEDLKTLNTVFIQTSPYSSFPIYNEPPHLFYDRKKNLIQYHQINIYRETNFQIDKLSYMLSSDKERLQQI